MARRRRKPKNGWVERAACLPAETYPGYDRKKFRACIIDQATEKKSKAKRPFALLTMGVPGTGKTTTVAPLLKGKSYVCSCPDDIKEQIPEYALALSKRAKNAGSVVQKESVEIAGRVADRAVRERKNLLIDGTGAILDRYKKVIRKLRRAGYRVKVVGVYAPFPVVKKRLESRAKVTGRFVPTKVASWYAGQVPCNFLPVAKLADDFALYDVSGKTRKAVLIKKDGKVKSVDPAKLARITASCRLK